MKFHGYLADKEEFIWFCPEGSDTLIAINKYGAVFDTYIPSPTGLTEITPEQAFLWIRKQNLSLNDLYTR